MFDIQATTKLKHIQKKYGTVITRTDDIIDSDGDHRNKMLAVKSKIHKQNDSDVELNDYSVHTKMVPLKTSCKY